MRPAAMACVVCFFSLCSLTASQEPAHEHPAPEKLGRVSFPTTCAPGVQAKFERAVALLHSFAYRVADEAFAEVAREDPKCAMAGWGEAMANFHQIWEDRISPAGLERGKAALEWAMGVRARTARERGYIDAVALMFVNTQSLPYEDRLQRYEQAMERLAANYPQDPEARIFYALALLATAAPDDRTHRNQKKAVALLEPLYREFPEHPGVVHYLIHADDNAEMAQRGLEAARVYARIAPSAPHALHMPSHIFTRLGMWEESIRSNLAAQAAAHDQGDTGEELHAMDYLVYAYLQLGREADAARVLGELRGMGGLPGGFKTGYAATAMPVRYAVERREWAEAAASAPAAGASPWVEAVAVWARAVGRARTGDIDGAQSEITKLERLQQASQSLREPYWAEQVRIQVLEADGWYAQANGESTEAETALRRAADLEDGIEKRPVTPGPVTPAREQLADLLLEQGHAKEALAEYENALGNSPGRRGALQGALAAAEKSKDEPKARLYRLALQKSS